MIFCDSTFWLAMRNVNDPYNEAAACILDGVEDRTIITTELIRGDVATHLKRNVGSRPALAFIDALEVSPRVRVVPVPPAAQRDAMAWLRAHPAHPATFMEAVNHAMMRRLCIVEILTFSRGYEGAGFEILTA